jgi:hypothetical protein
VIPVARKVWQPILNLHAELAGAALDHAPGIDPVHGFAIQLASPAARRAEESAFVVAGNPSSL